MGKTAAERGLSDDDPAVMDCISLAGAASKRAEILHRSSAAVAKGVGTAKVIGGETDDRAAVVDGVGRTVGAAEGSQVLHRSGSAVAKGAHVPGTVVRVA